MRKLVLSSLIALLPAAASAATLTGDTIYMQIPGVGNGLVTVGAGHDVMLGGTNFDFDAGSNRNVFEWNNNMYDTNYGITSVVLGNLNFDDGSKLTGFVVSDNQFNSLQVAVTETTLTFTFEANAALTAGKVISGTYLTSGGAASQSVPSSVPLPASAPLLLLGAGAIAMLRRRKSRG